MFVSVSVYTFLFRSPTYFKSSTFRYPVAKRRLHTADQTEPERFYHGFVVGMVVNMADTYLVRSNRESGYGRYDVMLELKNNSLVKLCFKALSLQKRLHCLLNSGNTCLHQCVQRQTLTLSVA